MKTLKVKQNLAIARFGIPRSYLPDQIQYNEKNLQVTISGVTSDYNNQLTTIQEAGAPKQPTPAPSSPVKEIAQPVYDCMVVKGEVNQVFTSGMGDSLKIIPRTLEDMAQDDISIEATGKGASKCVTTENKKTKKAKKKSKTSCARCSLYSDYAPWCSPSIGVRKSDKEINVLILVERPFSSGINPLAVEKDSKLLQGSIVEYLTKYKNQYLQGCNVIIDSAIRCFRKPDKAVTTAMIACCEDHLINQMHSFEPDYILCMGKGAALAFNITGRMKDIYNVIYTISPTCIAGKQIRNAKVLVTQSPTEYSADPVLLGATLEGAFIKLHRLITGETASAPDGYILIETPYEARKWLDDLKATPNFKDNVLAFDIETNGRDIHPKSSFDAEHPPKLRCISFSWDTSKAVCIPYERDPQGFKEVIQDIFNAGCWFTAHNSIFDIFFLRLVAGITMDRLAGDTMLMAALIDPGKGVYGYGLKPLAAQYTDLGGYEADMQSIVEEKDADNNITKNRWELALMNTLAPYNCADSDTTRQLFYKFKSIIDDWGMNQAHDIMTHAIFPLGEMEHNGFLVDTEWVAQAKEQLVKVIAAYKEELKGTLQGRVIDWDSPLEVAKELRQMPEVRKVKRLGDFDPESPESLEEFRTDDDALADIDVPFTRALRKYRKASKLLSTYFDGYLQNVGLDKYLRADYNLVGTRTGRLSSSGDANMQNIPKAINEGEPGYEELKDITLKRAFIARPGWKIVNADQSQLELRVAGAVSQEPGFINSYKHKIDMHSLNAKVSFNMSFPEQEKEWREQAKQAGLQEGTEDFDNFILLHECKYIKGHYHAERNAAKTVSFGVLYGMSEYGLARDLHNKNRTAAHQWTTDECKDFIDRFMHKFSKLAAWQAKQRKFAEKNEYICSYFGRRRPLPIPSASPNIGALRAQASRAAINTPIQSAGSDFMMCGVYNMYERLDHTKFRFCATVHDSVVCEVREDYVDEFIRIAKDCLEHPTLNGEPVGLTKVIPFVAEFEVGTSYGTLEEV